MGDRTYARITIPAHALATDQARVVVAEVLGLSPETLVMLLAAEPSSDTDEYENDCRLKLIRQVPCLVWSYDQANYGASSEELALASAGIPFLLVHGDGGEYSAGRIACDGSKRWSVEVNRSEEIVAVVDISEGRARIDPQTLVNINAYLSTETAVLTLPAPTGRRPKPRRRESP